MDTDDRVGAATLGFDHYMFVLRRQWRVVVAGAVLGAIAAVGYLVLAPQTVTATTTINLNVITTEPFSAQRAASGLLDDATETAIARSHVVASRASDLLDGLDDASTGSGSRRGFDPVELTVTLTADEHARLRDRADAQGVSLQEALRRLI